MNLLDIILLALSLAMDCFTVSIVSGAILRQWQRPTIFRIAFFFGFFQALMPLLGWLVMRLFATHVETYGHWIAFLLLLFVGGRMVWETFSDQSDEHHAFNPCQLITQLLLAVATSIDALAVGAGMAVTGYDSMALLTWPLVIIGLVSLLLSLLGHWLGIRFGRIACRKLRPELLGGIILILIGLKVLLSGL
ncbi:MAG: manganese efflux pump [Prevotella sp.]|nr:manganese efflux pump [Prevotella sp.]